MRTITRFNASGNFLSVTLSAILFFGASLLLTAGNVKLDDKANAFDIRNNSYSIIHFVSTFSNFNWFEVKTKMGAFARLCVEGYSNTEETGAPMLPVLRKLIEVPVDASTEVHILSITYEEHTLTELGIAMPVMPAQPPVAKNGGQISPFEYNAAIYHTDNFYGMEPVTVDVLGIMRGVRIGRINVAPVQYNPVKQTLRIIKAIDAEIVFKDGNLALTIREKQKNESPYFKGLDRFLVNYKPVQTRDTMTKYPVTLVIVSDPMFHDQLQPYIAWKIKKGFHVIEAYTDDPEVGNTTGSIKAYLQSLYESGTPENPAPSFVLFVGDVAQIPAWNLSGPSDLKYCEYTGDYFPEIYYGRFSANNPDELQPQIDKTLEYEEFTMPDPSYLGEVVMIGGMDANFGPNWANGQINYGTENYFNEGHGILSHTYLYPQSGSQAAQIIQNVSDGVGYANYTAHGSQSGWADPSFSISDIATLQNQDKYGLLVGNACLTNEFGTLACFGEALLRAENKGAVGYIGGSNSTYWDEDYYWAVGVGPITEDPPSYEETSLGAYDRMFHDHGESPEDWYTTQDQMIFAGNLSVTQGSPGSAQYYWEIYCLMGDPSLAPYMGMPAAMTVTYDPLMPLASTSFTVTAEPYAFVAISMDGVLYGSAVADETGLAEVPLTPITVPGTADIVVTAQNRQPFMGTVVVASPEGPYVLFNAYTINDESGNGNGLADYGENILLNLSLENVGNTGATNLMAVLTTDDPYVQITDNSNTWTDIPSGGIVTEEGAFAVSILDSIPDQHKVSFTLQVTDGSEVWNSTFTMTLNAPLLSLGNMTIADTLVGNGNGRLEAGEMAAVIVHTFNNGHSDAMDGTLALTTANEYLSLNTSSYDIGVIPYSQMAEASFIVTVDPATPIGTVAVFDAHLEALPYIIDKSYSTKIGLVVEDFETADFGAFDWQLSGDADWFITNANPYSGDFCAQSGDINDLQSSILQLSFDVTADDSISFFRKVSSEATYDFLKFYIDGVVMGEWSGEMDWSRVVFPVTMGTHVFKWSYEKDYSLSNGSDCGWVDYIVMPSVGGASGPLSLSVLAYPDHICSGQTGQLFAIPSGGSGTYTYLWSPPESLNDPTIFNPWATPSETTLYTVEVSDGQDTISGEVTLPVLELPPAPEIIQQGDDLISNMESGNQWYIWGQPIEGATGQIYTPMATGEYTATYTNENGCESVASNAIYFVYTGIENLTKDEPVTIYPNPFTEQVNINYFLEHPSSVSLTLYNAMGTEIAVLIRGENEPSGRHTFVLGASGLKAGLYYCRLQTADYTVIRKIILSE